MWTAATRASVTACALRSRPAAAPLLAALVALGCLATGAGPSLEVSQSLSSTLSSHLILIRCFDCDCKSEHAALHTGITETREQARV